MATFRTNHGAKRGRGSGTPFFRIWLLIFIGLGLLLVLGLLVRKDFFNPPVQEDSELVYEIPTDTGDPNTRYYLPVGGKGERVHHRYFSLSYLEEFELAEWVAYELTSESLERPNVPRTDWFTADPKVSTGSAAYGDYKNTGYTRGHLAPAGDMAFNDEAMENSFYMSNIAPQKRRFNNGIWKELEENIRDWALENGRLFIVTGPVLDRASYQRIGRNRVAVPRRFYKVVLDADDPEIKAVGFIIPNSVSERPLSDYMVSVDEIEAITGLDFFSELLSTELQEKTEADITQELWPVSEDRYRLRLEDWNK
jgi:endonuclease G